ncbi:MAG: hypothetical protein PHE27_08000 [Alphaproteobacteria bacterium]|nr:hypothetical protein [Alphaproteobacteria bacterium]
MPNKKTISASDALMEQVSNQVSPLFSDFTAAKKQVFDLTANGTLHLRLSTKGAVEIIEGKKNQIAVEVDADSKTINEFMLYQQRNSIFAEQTTPSPEPLEIKTVAQNKCTISIKTKNQTFKTTIKDKVVVTSGAEKHDWNLPSSQMPRIRVAMPVGTNLDISMAGGLFLSNVDHKTVKFETPKGYTIAGLKAENLDYTCKSRGSDIKAFIKDGDVDATMAEGGRLTVYGNPDNVFVQSGKNALFQLAGDILESVTVIADGDSRVYHTGALPELQTVTRKGKAEVHLGLQ